MNIADEFAEYLKVTENKSDNTVEAYIRNIVGFLDYAEKQGITVSDMSSAVLEDYALYLKDKGRKASGISQGLSSLYLFYEFAYQKGLVPERKDVKVSPAAYADSELPYDNDNENEFASRGITQEELVKLLETVSEDKVLEVRNKAIILLMCNTGIKSSEIIEISESDFNLTIGFVVLADGEKRITIPFDNDVKNAILRYIELSRSSSEEESPDGPLFLNRDGSRLSRQGLCKMIRVCAEKAGIEKEVTPLMLRKYFAANMLESGVAPEKVRELMRYKTKQDIDF